MRSSQPNGISGESPKELRAELGGELGGVERGEVRSEKSSEIMGSRSRSRSRSLGQWDSSSHARLPALGLGARKDASSVSWQN